MLGGTSKGARNNGKGRLPLEEVCHEEFGEVADGQGPLDAAAMEISQDGLDGSLSSGWLEVDCCEGRTWDRILGCNCHDTELAPVRSNHTNSRE